MKPTENHSDEKKTSKRYTSQMNSFKKTRDYQSQQEAIMLGILNRFQTYTLMIPSKRQCKSVPFIPLQSILDENEEINCNEIITSRLEEFYQMDIDNGLPERTAIRRKKANLVAETINFLVDVIERHGYEFESKQSTGNKGIQKDTLNAIASSDHYFDKNDIVEKGNKLNSYFLKKMTDGGITTFQKGDPEIAAILGL